MYFMDWSNGKPSVLGKCSALTVLGGSTAAVLTPSPESGLEWLDPGSGGTDPMRSRTVPGRVEYMAKQSVDSPLA